MFVELLFDFRANRLHLRRAEAVQITKYDVECADLAQVDHRNARSFLILRSLDGEATVSGNELMFNV